MSHTIPLASTDAFSKTFLAYIEGDETLASFYSYAPTIANFSKQLKNKVFTAAQRAILKEAFIEQYKNDDVKEATSKSIDLISAENTFTITTGHQLSIFGGPMYFIYKIITTVKTAKELQKKYPSYNFVPVFWMASEDHDFEEINNFNWFGKNWKWETTQKGAVGKFTTTGIDRLLDLLPEKVALFEHAYRNSKSLADATRIFVHELFGDTGLLVLDGDVALLKKQVAPYFKEELLTFSSNSLVQKQSEKLKTLGFDTQVNPRPINLFYLDDGIRERILFENGTYKINNTTLSYSEAELLTLLEQNPEKFSPNVLLRPLYQEIILPNLAYIGGPAEVVYWLQLKTLFEYHQVVFPLLMPRNFALYLTKQTQKRLQKLNLTPEALFSPLAPLKNNFLAKITSHEFSLADEQLEVSSLFEKIKNKAGAIDKSLEATVLAELQKTIKAIETIEHRLKKAEEKKNETEIAQLVQLKEKLFPDGGLQERHDNFLNFYVNNPLFIHQLLEHLDPFTYAFYILKEND